MDLTLNITNIIFIIGALQGYVLSILLFTKYRHLKVNKYLAWLILLYSLFVTQSFFDIVSDIEINYPHISRIIDGLPFLFGPLHLMYVGKLTDSRLKFAQPHWYHFLPFIIYKVFNIQVFFLSKEELKHIIELTSQNVWPWHLVLFNFLVAVQGLIYAIAALYVFREYSAKIRATFSSLEKINLTWLRYFTVLALLVWIVVFINFILTFCKFGPNPLFHLVPILTSIFVYATGYVGMLKTEIFTQYNIYENIHDVQSINLEMNPINLESNTETKYKKSGLTEEKAEEILGDLTKLMKKDLLFTNPEITLRELAEKLKTSTHNISEVINTKLNQNFFDFINNYRVEKVKKDLLDKTKNHLTLFGIANEAGFNSKSGFNAIFKRYTGLTPSEYRNEIT